MPSNDLSLATRELYLRSLVHEVYERSPILDDLQKRNQIITRGGKTIDRSVVKSTLTSTAQNYLETTALTDEQTDQLVNPSFLWKRFQIPLRYGGETEIQNVNAGREEQLQDLAKFLVEQGHDATRMHLMRLIFNQGSVTGQAEGAGEEEFQSIVSALDFDVTYGGITRTGASGVANYWQASQATGTTPNPPEGSTITDVQGTAATMSLANMRAWRIGAQQFAKTQEDIMYVMCPTLYNKVRAEMESRNTYRPIGDTAKQGFNKMEFDGHSVVSVPYLETTAVMKKWVFILNLRYWELRINTARNFKVTPFVWQGDRSNGHDYYLARILVAGNFMCWKPNANTMLTNVT